MIREIPQGSVEIQEGLWLYSYNKVISGKEYTFRQLYSAEGYCFYNHTWTEEARTYWQYMSLGLADSPDNYTSIPVSQLPEGAEIA